MKLLTASLLTLAMTAAAVAQNDTAPAATDKPAAAATNQPADASQPAAEPAATTQPAEGAPAADAAAPANGLDSLAKRAGYAFGLNIGQNIKAQMIEVDMDAMAQGLRDGFEGNQPLLDEQAAQQAMIELQQYVQGKQMEQARVQGSKNKTEGETFLAKNKAEEGVKTTASGLQYKVMTPGEGESPKPSDVVTVHYVGKLLDGTEFDSSYKRNQPATFPVNGVIAGWTEALQLMKPGAKYRLFIPSDLAYGDQGVGDVIGPNAVLVFDVELLSVQAGQQQPGHEGHNHAPGEGH